MSKTFDKTMRMLALPLAIQLAVAGALLWKYYDDQKNDQHHEAKISAASKISALSTSLRSLVEAQPPGFATSGIHLVKEIQTVAATPAISDRFDQADYKLALGDLTDIETLAAKEQSSTASSYRPQLLNFSKEQLRRADAIIAEGQGGGSSLLLFGILCAAGCGINIAATLWCMQLFNREATRRLNVISDNTERLEHGITLNTMFSGTDGFAALDRRFHDMAETLEKAQERLRKSEYRFRLVLENMPVGVLLATTGGLIESANPKACEVLACGPARLSGKPVTDFFSLPEGQSLDAISSNERTLLVAALKDDKTAFNAEINVSKYRDEESEKLLVSFEDVTWRIELEKMKREFMAMISHDIRTPLTAISSTLGMLSGGGFGDLADDVRARIEKDEDSLEHLMRLLNDLLSIEKIASTSFTLQKSATTTAKIVERTLAIVTPTAKAKQIDIGIAGSHCRLSADEDRMVQVMTNLLTNAIKFSPVGGTVTIGIENLASELQLKVSDQGNGVPPGEQEKIFESFGQVQSKDFAGAKGIGLGLAICKQIVVQHGGQIGVTSVEGQGSTFWLTVPHTVQLQTDAGTKTSGTNTASTDDSVTESAKRKQPEQA